VSQQVANRDVPFAVSLESRDEGGDAVVQPDAAVLDEDHHAGRRRDPFGERCDIEDRVRRHRLDRRHQCAVADRLLVDDAVAVADEHHRSRELPFGNRLLDDLRDQLEAADVERNVGFSVATQDRDARRERHEQGDRHRPQHRRWIILCAYEHPMLRTLLAGTLLVVAQQSPQPPFRSTTELVEVDVRVLDKDGRFVTTLNANDFELREDDAPRAIEVVYLVADGVAASVPAGGAANAVAATNPPTPATRQTWIFVFDVPHLSAAGLTRTREAVRNFIKQRFRDGDLGGIVGDRGMVNKRLTSSREELQSAAAAVKLAGGRRDLVRDMREWPRLRDELETLQIAGNDREILRAAMLRACQDDPTFCSATRRGEAAGDPDAQIEMMLMEKARRIAREIRNATLQTIDTLTALAGGLAAVPGPKTVVLLSEGFVTRELEANLQGVIGRAAAAGARFYTIDARGLARGGIAEMIDAYWADSAVGALGSGQDMHSDGTNALAIDTGGFAIRNENNFGRALDLVAEDSRAYYVLGYRPANAAYDGKYRRIDVDVKRAGLKVRARRGYLSVAPAHLLTRSPSAVPTSSGVAASMNAPSSVAPLPELPRLRHMPGVSDDVIRKVLELAREAGGVQAPGTAASGWAAYQRGDVATAARELRAAIASGDTRPWVYYACGFTNAAQGDWKAAVSAWERVRTAVPEFQDVYFDLADAHLQSNDHGSAIAVLREAEKRWPSNAEIYNAIGVVQVSRGALDAAVETLEKAVSVAPRDSLSHFNLGRVYSLRFLNSQRRSTVTGTWISRARDRDRAVAQFRKYIALGGPYVRQAQDALALLEWK
jgi:VWFA-related protein